MNQHDIGGLDKLKVRIQALRAKTIDNGCTEEEALSAAAKVAELLDRYDLSLTDVELRAAPCERRVYETHRKKRIPLDDCIGAIAHFCDCRVWREKNAAGESSYVFFGLRPDIEVAHYLTELIDSAVRAGLGRFKTSAEYGRFRHQERHLANASFALGMVASIADKLMALKVYTKPPARGETREQGILGRNFTVRKLRDGTEIALGGPVYFDALSPDPTPEGKEQLQRVVELLKGHRNIIEVRGHTADTAIPQDWTNLDLMKLSYQRAEYVGKILLANGIDSRAIRLTAAGSAEPASREKNPDPLERTHSQRVEIFVRESLVDDYTGQDPRPADTSAPAPSPT